MIEFHEILTSCDVPMKISRGVDSTFNFDHINFLINMTEYMIYRE